MIHQDMAQPAFNNQPEQAAAIKLIGVGGGGCNAVEHMIGADIHGVDFTLVNTDAQALSRYNPDNVIQLGNTLTRGLGAGTDPEVGRLAAEEDADVIAAAIGDTDMLFLTAGMGGGTGTGAIPVIARIARELGVLTVAVVTKPFAFEGGKRRQVAEVGLAELRKHVDSLIVVPNENLLTHLGPNISLIEAFAASNDVLTNAVQSIAELITNPGLINVDFADVKSVMTETGEAMMSTGRGIGEYRARDAAIAATESPLLDEIDLNEARGILANVTASDSLSMGEFQIVGDILDQITAEDANVVIGTVFDPDMSDEIRVTVVATGLQTNKRQSPPPAPTEKKPASAGFLGLGNNRNSGILKQKADEHDATVRQKNQAGQRPVPSEVSHYSHPAPQQHAYQAPVDEQSYDEAHYEAPVPTQSPREVVSAEPELKLCQACGNRPDNHTHNCPLKDTVTDYQPVAAAPAAPVNEPTEVKSFLLDERNGPDQMLSQLEEKSSRQRNYDTSEFDSEFAKPRSRFHGGKRKSIRKHIAGLAAGAAVLASVFYMVISNKMTVDDTSLSSTKAVSTELAGRKLRDAQQRLSGL